MSGNSIFGIHETAARLQSQRASLISNNLVNSETPGFLARDIDNKTILGQNYRGGSFQSQLEHSQQQHIAGTDTLSKPRVMYRMPTQVSLNGNTVETDVEKVKFMENSQRYLASMQFMNGTITSLRKAIKGE